VCEQHALARDPVDVGGFDDVVQRRPAIHGGIAGNTI
jgi:hypothetical protein